MKNISETYEFLKKNLKAIIHLNGYRIVKIKKRNSQKILTRLSRQKEASVARFDEEHISGLVNKNKYFSVQVDAKPGINVVIQTQRQKSRKLVKKVVH